VKEKLLTKIMRKIKSKLQKDILKYRQQLVLKSNIFNCLLLFYKVNSQNNEITPTAEKNIFEY